MEKIVKIFRLHYILIVILIVFGACEKKTLSGPVYESDVYIVGYDPSVANRILSTPYGKGRGFLVETIGSNPDTLMMYGIPADMFDIPDEWIIHCKGKYLLPEAGQKKFKMRISYQESSEVLSIFACNAMYPAHPRKYFINEYIIVKAEKIE